MKARTGAPYGITVNTVAPGLADTEPLRDRSMGRESRLEECEVTPGYARSIVILFTLR